MKSCIIEVILAVCCMLTQLWGLDRKKERGGKKGQCKAQNKIKEEMSLGVVRGFRSIPANHPLYFAI